MNKNLKSFIAAVITYAITRIGYRLANFKPINEFSFLVALLIAVSIWMILFYLILQVIEKLFPTKESKF